MKRLATGLVVVFALSGLFAGEAQAKGCLKGAAVGAVAGHMAHHHAVIGAITGCIVGHHLAHKHDHDVPPPPAKPHSSNGASGQY
jgi:outer membrane lipoprotein SlyB